MEGILKHAPKGGLTITRKSLTPSKNFQEAMKHLGERDQRIRDQANILVKKEDEIILQTLKKAGANIDDIPQLAKDCESHIHPDGKKVLHYKGKPILVFYPPKYDLRREGISFYSDAGFKYKILI